MTSNSTPRPSLSARLQQQLQADQAALAAQTQATLQQHAHDLRKLSASALHTTGSAIQRYGQSLEQLHANSLKQTRRLLMWPLAAAAALSISMVLGASAWSAWTIQAANTPAQATCQR